MPGQQRWPLVEPFVLDTESDQVSGRLFDTGLGYPAARFDQVGVVIGEVFTLDPDRRTAALELLDEVEGAVAGLYHRVRLVTASGCRAFGYQYGGGIEQLSAIAGGDWLKR